MGGAHSPRLLRWTCAVKPDLSPESPLVLRGLNLSRALGRLVEHCRIVDVTSIVSAACRSGRVPR